MQKILATYLVLAFTVSCGSAPQNLQTVPASQTSTLQDAHASALRDAHTVIGGTPTSAFPAVGLLTYPLGNNQVEFCTATLVTPNQILTAGHCVMADRAQGVSSWDTARFTFTLGQTPLTSPGQSAKSTHAQTPTAFAQYAPDYGTGGVPESFSDADMAVVTLASSINQTPLSWATSVPATGTNITMVGYGLTNAADSGSYGVKNTVTAQLLRFDQDPIVAHWGDATHTICHGDSGGPVLQALNGGYQVIATVSTGACNGPGNGPTTSALSGWLASALAGQTPTPQPAPAPTPAPTLSPSSRYKVLSVSTGGSLDVPNGSKDNGTLIKQWSYWGGTNQQWTLVPLSDGTYEIANVNSGLCLSVLNASNDDGGRIQQWQCFAGNNQKWRLTRLSNGSYNIVGNASNKCLDLYNNSAANGTAIQQWTCWGGTNQAWTLTAL